MRLETISDTATGETADFPEELNNELDLPPEYHHYRDEGCEMASAHLGYQSSCLNCPFPKCVYDQYGGKQRWLNQLRDREMVRLFNNGEKGIKELAQIFGVSQRTTQRAIKRFKNE